MWCIQECTVRNAATTVTRNVFNMCQRTVPRVVRWRRWLRLLVMFSQLQLPLTLHLLLQPLRLLSPLPEVCAIITQPCCVCHKPFINSGILHLSYFICFASAIITGFQLVECIVLSTFGTCAFSVAGQTVEFTAWSSAWSSCWLWTIWVGLEDVSILQTFKALAH